jgi:catechol 2,3-dioxygenase-like lactoylglutathione lyase family enzyme
MSVVKVIGLHHFQLAMPRGQEDAARLFYVQRLGFTEIPKPKALAGRGGVWFLQAGINIHLGVEDTFTAAKKAHPAFTVENLENAFKSLEDIAISRISVLPGIKRFYISDPFGNRIEILEEV